ncbi:MAG TPA: carboxymuconolactone decarboxylase family protein [Mycobacterium sp.]|jgi:alkylhydroperoxidase family enzyme|nr:carboxymuconolactone decarboxylase family protein [Mycobacterium sp.]
MTSYKNHSARIRPASAPLQPDMQEAIDAVMRGAPPLVLFTTMARDRRLFFKFFNSGLLDRGNLTIREREIVIDRVTASCGAEYEWGVHVSVYAEKAGLTETQIASLFTGGPDDECWADEDRVLIRLCDDLHQRCTVDDEIWAQLAACHSDEAILELLMLAGTYRTVSYLVNGLRLPLEPGARRFPVQGTAGKDTQRDTPRSVGARS